MFKQVQFEVALDSVTPRFSNLIQPEILVAVARAPDILSEFAHEALPILTVAFNDRNWNIATVRDAVLNPSSCQLLITARATEELIGFVTVHSSVHQHVGKLHWLTVIPERQGQGIGKMLTVTACRVACTELGYRTMILKTEIYRRAAISLYRNLGFREFSTP